MENSRPHTLNPKNAAGSASAPDAAWYSLRRTLPLWNFEANLEELVQMLPRYRIDELVVKVDTEEFSHGQPPLEWVQAYQEKLYRIEEAMRDIGVVYSLNPWITLGHIDRGRNARAQVPGMQTMVGHDGVEARVSACPLCPAWREHVAAIWTLYAETRPEVVWVEDDIRLFNHLPVHYGCFCPLHLKRFGERTGRTVTREELAGALLAPGEPHPWRAAFLDMQAEVMRETARFLAETIHAVSPETRMGVMSSGPRRHCLEGRHWHAFAEALADGRPLVSRPPLGSYEEASPRELYYAKDSILLTRHCLPEGVEEQTEVENVPFTRYSKSVRFTFLQMALSYACGASGATLNLFDHCGTPMETEPHYGRMLADHKAYFSALCQKSVGPGDFRGIRLLFHEAIGAGKHLPEEAAPTDLEDPGEPMMRLLESHGFATTYSEETVAAACGEQLRSFSDEALRGLLSRGLFLDGSAARVLVERGFGEWIGLEAIENGKCIDTYGPFAAEEFYDEDFGGAPGRFLTLTLPDLAGRPAYCKPKLAAGTRMLSELVDADAVRHLPALYIHENAAGGRVAVHLLDLNSAYGTAYNHPFRKTQLRGVLTWLGWGAPPLEVEGGVYPLALRKDTAKTTFLALFNLTLDAWPETVFRLNDPREAVGTEVLNENGAWEEDASVAVSQRDGIVEIRVSRELPPASPLFMSLWWMT